MGYLSFFCFAVIFKYFCVGFCVSVAVFGMWGFKLEWGLFNLKMWGVSVLSESQPMKTGGWKVSCDEAYKLYTKHGQPERSIPIHCE